MRPVGMLSSRTSWSVGLITSQRVIPKRLVAPRRKQLMDRGPGDQRPLHKSNGMRVKNQSGL